MVWIVYHVVNQVPVYFEEVTDLLVTDRMRELELAEPNEKYVAHAGFVTSAVIEID